MIIGALMKFTGRHEVGLILGQRPNVIGCNLKYFSEREHFTVSTLSIPCCLGLRAADLNFGS